MYPHRVKGLIVYGSLASGSPSKQELDALGMTAAQVQRKWNEMEAVVSDWGKGRSLEILAPNAVDIPLAKRRMATYERSSVSPSMARVLIDNYKAVDVTDLLSSIAVPTLVLHRVGDWVPIEFGRFLAANIPGARLVELPGEDHMFIIGDYDLMLSETKRFVTGDAPVLSAHRVLMSVLFTDIVNSTARATALGDAAWRRLLELHTEISRRTIAHGGGQLVKNTGDGVLATFPGPARAIECAEELVRELRSAGIPIRAGIHTGECEIIDDDIGGVAVHIGARVASLAGEGEILVSSTTKELVLGSGIEFDDRGHHELKGVPDTWRLFAVGHRSIPPRVEAAAANMTLSDRLTVRMARRMPAVLRAANRLVERNAT
jgi:class 3 adenylate cyclase